MCVYEWNKYAVLFYVIQQRLQNDCERLWETDWSVECCRCKLKEVFELFFFLQIYRNLTLACIRGEVQDICVSIRHCIVALWFSMFIFTKQCKRVYFDGHLWWTKWTNLCTVMGDDDTDILLHFDFDTMSLTRLF